MSEDWAGRYKNKLLQLERQSQHWAPAKSQVWVRENEQGAIAISYREQSLPFTQIPASPRLSRGRVLPLPRALRDLLHGAPPLITPGDKAGSK